MEERESSINRTNYYISIFDFQGKDERELQFKKGQIIEVRRKDESGWAKGNIRTINEKIGWLPLRFVSKITPEEADRLGQSSPEEVNEFVRKRANGVVKDLRIEELSFDLAYLKKLRGQIRVKESYLQQELAKLRQADQKLISLVEKRTSILHTVIDSDDSFPLPVVGKLSREIPPDTFALLEGIESLEEIPPSGSFQTEEVDIIDNVTHCNDKEKGMRKKFGMQSGVVDRFHKWNKNRKDRERLTSSSPNNFYEFIPESKVNSLVASMPKRRVVNLKDDQVLNKTTGPDSINQQVCIRGDPLQTGYSAKFPEDGSWVSAASVSTYPWPPAKPHREGDPMCDRYGIRVYQNRIFASLTDGCNWGHRPALASQHANDGFLQFLEDKSQSVKTIRQAGQLVLAALEAAHKNVLVESKGDPADAGTTTLIGGMLVEMIPDQSNHDTWAFVFASIGDCKAFHWSSASHKLVDVTAGNRTSLIDVRDPGPHTEVGEPDLRNLGLYYCPCTEGDLLLLVSDGIHDNFDPQLIGLTPEALGFHGTWEAVEKIAPEAIGEAKTKFQSDRLRALLEEPEGSITPASVTKRIIKHCVTLTSSARGYMEENPEGKQPADYHLYPGKMDHTTVLAFRVGNVPKLN